MQAKLFFFSLFILLNLDLHAANSALLFSAEINYPDSLLQQEKQHETLETIPQSQFTLAGNPRYTIFGTLPPVKTSFKPLPSAVVGTVYISAMVGLHLYQKKAWWSGERRNFHFMEDWVSALQVDKVGHAYGGYIMSYFCGEGLLASGADLEDASLWGFLLGTGYQTFVEYEDGFATEWGFSPSDFYFDVIGGLYYLAQVRVPVLQNVMFKWQYVPTDWTKKPVIDRPRTFVDDYNSSTFWLSVKVANFLPEKAKRYWPSWLLLSFGYGADAIDAKFDPNGPPDQLSHRRYVVGLDFDFVDLIPDGSPFWNWWKQNLNAVKFPGPTLEFSKSGTKFYFVYPFMITF